MQVIVIGGGTGGMCLAHGLKQAGVSVAVYERYANRADGLHGYRVGIDPTGNRALKQCLPAALFDLFLATCATAPKYFNVLTEQMKTTASFPLRGDHDAINSERSVSRSTLRQLLFTGMEDVVHFGKVFTHYVKHADGSITAYFADGSSARGDVLVAADGTHSAVRQQYLPHAKICETGITAIATKTPLTAQTRALLAPHLTQGLSLIFARGGLTGMLHVMTFPWNAPAQHRSAHCAAQLERWTKSQCTTEPDYINLSIWSSHSRFPEHTCNARGQALLDIVKPLTRQWSPELRQILALADPGSAFPLRIVTSSPIPPWPPGPVTLLGDAIHTMTPGQGVGANTALRDAALLSQELVAVAQRRKPLLAAIGDYEAQMRPYGFARVADSLNNNGTRADDPYYHPVLGRMTLHATRAYFKLTHVVPCLRSRFINSLYRYRGAS
ncbi:2-polyprenyl-6-methoxyphenol hydroxylase [Andreprevotia lacus DSM 23236]|uniref:2-polyprenyl-6-methoxyphenol hydroxylase n=1 Tax=Andreprevotia lacus DSM 23236 TaxID=1121001 RepID=A0A1W1XK09_9NEIS|nr:FAD-dependent monooxygenase [Andreprevotia lacus]SMC23881.1 2-polyprenyl-6-methoxyphenol hydroxylase [Andreprevotia lacus DSM 23236]